MSGAFLQSLPKDKEVGRNFKGEMVFEKLKIAHQYGVGDRVRCAFYEINVGEIKEREWMNAPGRAAYPHYAVYWTDQWGRQCGLWLPEKDLELLAYVARPAPPDPDPEPANQFAWLAEGPKTKRQRRRARGKRKGTANGR